MNVINKPVECKVITPIISKSLNFSVNGSPSYKIYHFELRPQSIKGVLHFWFRAIAPRVIDIYTLNFHNIADKDERKKLEKLYEKEKYKGLKFLESMIFGSQNEKAPFGLIVKYDQGDTAPIDSIRLDNKKEKSEPDLVLKKLSYPLYGTYYTSKSNPKDNFVCSCLKPESTFELKFFVKDELTWNVIYSLLKIVSVLSGFGAKTTKGFGQFEIINDKDFHREKYTNLFEIEKLISQVEEALTDYIKEYDKNKLIEFGKIDVSDFPNLTDDAFKFFGPIATGTQWHDIMSKLYYVSRSSKGWYRQLKFDLRKLNQEETPKFDAVKNLIECLEGRLKQVEISPAILGMPLQYQRLKSRVSKITFYPKVPGETNDRGRKPSPLRIIINKSGQGYTAYGLLLKSKLTSDKELIYDISSNFNAKLTTTFDQLSGKIEKSINKGGRSH
ncbi:MAG TPA: type III-B CRISPR module RAMP protein Cmr1 [Pseudothermotoga sp.]